MGIEETADVASESSHELPDTSIKMSSFPTKPALGSILIPISLPLYLTLFPQSHMDSNEVRGGLLSKVENGDGTSLHSSQTIVVKAVPGTIIVFDKYLFHRGPKRVPPPGTAMDERYYHRAFAYFIPYGKKILHS